MPSRTQITRHDCVEGWSTIGKWTGVPLERVLDWCEPQPQAHVRRLPLRRLDGRPIDGDSRYYESIDLDDAYHPQTILAYELNDKPLPVANGAPLRCGSSASSATSRPSTSCASSWSRASRNIRGGKGGYWEDQATSGTAASRANAVIGCARFELAPLVGWAATLCDWDEAKNLPYRYRRVCFYRISTP